MRRGRIGIRKVFKKERMRKGRHSIWSFFYRRKCLLMRGFYVNLVPKTIRDYKQAHAWCLFCNFFFFHPWCLPSYLVPAFSSLNHFLNINIIYCIDYSSLSCCCDLHPLLPSCLREKKPPAVGLSEVSSFSRSMQWGTRFAAPVPTFQELKHSE